MYVAHSKEEAFVLCIYINMDQELKFSNRLLFLSLYSLLSLRSIHKGEEDGIISCMYIWKVGLHKTVLYLIPEKILVRHFYIENFSSKNHDLKMKIHNVFFFSLLFFSLLENIFIENTSSMGKKINKRRVSTPGSN